MLPDKETVKKIAPYVLPVTTSQVGCILGYVAMSHVVLSSLGTISMAAQQVIVSLFYCLTPVAASLSLTAQSFFQPSMKRSEARSVPRPSSTLLSIFSKRVQSLAQQCLLLWDSFHFSQVFTSDPSVITLTNSVVPLLVGFFAVHGPLCLAEGLLVGQKDLSFLG